jgi:hypothetical protein
MEGGASASRTELANDMYPILKKIGRGSRLLLAGVLLMGVLVWISLSVWTVPVALVWHLFHGNLTSFDGHDIHVPWDMWIYRSAGQTLMITREAPRYSILRSPAGTMLIERSPGRATDMLKDYDRIARTNEQPPTGYRLDRIRQVPTAKGTGYCWELARIDSPYLSISCWFDKDTLAASYGGSPIYRDEFYKVLAAISNPPSQSSP